jgi:hypothetical protein
MGKNEFGNFENSEKKENDDTVAEARSALRKLQEDALKAKEEGRGYAIDIAELRIEAVGQAEADLWHRINSIRSAEDYDAVLEIFEKYRRGLNDELDKLHSEGKSAELALMKGRVNFCSIVGNELGSLGIKFELGK